MRDVWVLVVDDYEPWRRYVSSTLKNKPQLKIICEVSDGLEAVRKAEELRPDLILLDIGLPSLNGIEAARRIRKVAPTSRILFLTENYSPDIAAGALSTGGSGYVVKSDAAGELLPAVEAVLQGNQFVSTRLACYILMPAGRSRSRPPPNNERRPPLPDCPRRIAFRTERYTRMDRSTTLWLRVD